MTRCLTDRALTRLLVDLGKHEERAHLAVCAACGDRYRRLEGEMTEIAHVLAGTPEPRARTMPATGRWIAAAAALAAVVAGVWFSVETGVPIRAMPASPEDPRVAMALADIGAALFSVDGEPRRLGATREPGAPLGPDGALEPDAIHEAACETVAGTSGIYCADGALGLDEGMGALDLEINGPSAGRSEGRDEGA